MVVSYEFKSQEQYTVMYSRGKQTTNSFPIEASIFVNMYTYGYQGQKLASIYDLDSHKVFMGE